MTDLTEHEKVVVGALDKELDLPEVRKRKRKKPQGPNPLSVKKKAKKVHAPILTSHSQSKNQVFTCTYVQVCLLRTYVCV